MKKLLIFLLPILFFVSCEEPKDNFPEITYSTWEEVPFMTRLLNGQVAVGYWCGDTIKTAESRTILKLKFALDMSNTISNRGLLWCDTINIKNLEWYNLPDSVNKNEIHVDSIGFVPGEVDTLFHAHSMYIYNDQNLSLSETFQYSTYHLEFAKKETHPVFGNEPAYKFVGSDTLFINNFQFARSYSD